MEIAIIGFGLLVTILWLIIGWRAMKAHESLATQVTRYNDCLESENLAKLKQDFINQKKLYAKFLRENPDDDSLTSKDRHLQFRNWLEENS